MKPLVTGDPTRIAEFELIGRLGAGGMGVVYLGHRAADNAEAAVKVLLDRHRASADPGIRAEFETRFEREAVAAQSVRSPRVAAVLEVGHDQDRAYLACEYVRGPTLREAVAAAEGHRLTERQVADLAQGLAEALVAIHGAGLVHRDLTPDNVVLTHAGPKVIDFGIARMEQMTNLTATGNVIGTPGYIAPERLIRGVSLAAGDVYCVGALLLFAATGRPPLQDGLGIQESLTANLVGIPAQTAALIRSTLAFEPENRPDATLLATLAQGLSPVEPGATAVLAQPSQPTHPNQAQPQPQPQMWSLPGAYTQAAAYPAPEATLTDVPATGTAATAKPQRRRIAVLAGMIVAVLLAGSLAYALSQNSASKRPMSGGTPHATIVPTTAAPSAAEAAATAPTNAAGTASAADATPTSALPATWSSGASVNSAASDGLTTVSCSSADYCMTADSNGNLYSYSNGSWSSVEPISGEPDLTDISCASATFCAATTSSAGIYVYSDGSWSTSQLIGADGVAANLTAVSCPTTGSCVAIGDWDAYTYANGHWSNGVLIQNTDDFSALSCSSPTSCTAVDSDGNAYVDSDGHWSGADSVSDGTSLTGISCASATFCAATTSSAGIYVYSNETWSSSQLVGADGVAANLTAISCPATGNCIATGDWDAYTYANGQWSNGVLIQNDNDFTALSCSSPTACTAVDSDGNAYEYSSAN